MKTLFNVLGVVLVILGLFSLLEGARILNVITLVHHTRYVLGGIAVVVVGVVAFVFANRRPKSTPPAS